VHRDFKYTEYFKPGFFIFVPPHQMYDLYYAILNMENPFDSRYPEQNLLNYAHRKGGKMP
jgi:hypothetical protein